MIRSRQLVFALIFIGLALGAFAKTLPPSSYYGQQAANILIPTGCNASDNAPVPGMPSLFIGRQLFKPDGSPLPLKSGCGNSEASEAIRNNRWGLVLSKLNWATKQFTILKSLLVPPLKIPAGPFKGVVIRAAYDADIVVYRGKHIVAFECTFGPAGQTYGIDGTSSCLATYNAAKQEIDPETINVVVSGKRAGALFYSASVPNLLVWDGRLFIYYSAVTVRKGKFVRVVVRGAEITPNSEGFYWVEGVGRLAYATDPRTVEVWVPEEGSRLTDTSVDLKSVWTRDGKVLMLAGLGGEGCAAPGPQPGCFRMSVSVASHPLTPRVFNQSLHVNAALLPTNPQGYTRPVRNPEGKCLLLGNFFRPAKNGFSDLRPTPPDWGKIEPNGILVAFPFDETLCPDDYFTRR